MNWEVDDTIAAIATAPAGARRGIIRVSGPDAMQVCDRIFQIKQAPEEDASRFDSLRSTTAVSGHVDLDGHGLPGRMIVWPTKRSYTRQPTAELHTLGSLPLLQKTLKLICSSGARLAQPGEFTLRAFLSGRIDLTQAEAVLGVIDSNGEDQLKDALQQLAGGLSTPLDSIRTSLINILAELEAGLDFVEEDIEFITRDAIIAGLTDAQDQLTSLIEQIGSRDTQIHRPRVVLIGPPNAGKSSLFNTLIGNDRAIVADVSGTTRDFVSANLQCGNVEVELIDTAGLESSNSQNPENQANVAIADQAQDFSVQVFKKAELLIVCHDAGTPVDDVRNFIDRNAIATRISEGGAIIVTTKCDSPDARADVPAGIQGHCTSSTTGRGISQLKHLMSESILKSIPTGTGIVSTTAVRASESLECAAESVSSALGAEQGGLGQEIVASEIRRALDELGCVVGTVYTDDILDRIFSQFCIGK